MGAHQSQRRPGGPALGGAGVTFSDWLKLLQWREDGVGDMARRVAAGDDAPPGHAAFVDWRRYLEGRGAGPGELEALLEAWLEFRGFV